MKIQHPDFPEVVRDVPDAQTERWLIAGWTQVASEPEPIADEPDACPTCGAVGDEPCQSYSGAATYRHFAR